MQALNTYGPLLGRVMIGILFLLAGLSKLADMSGFTSYLVSGGLPAILSWPAVLFEIAVGLAIIAGFQTRIAALAAAAFCLVAGLLYHLDFSNQLQVVLLLKNIAIAGGLLMYATHGAGRFAVDKTA